MTFYVTIVEISYFVRLNHAKQDRKLYFVLQHKKKRGKSEWAHETNCETHRSKMDKNRIDVHYRVERGER